MKLLLISLCSLIFSVEAVQYLETETTSALRSLQLDTNEESQVCACQPTTITFQIALEQTCDTNASLSPGIETFECKIENLTSGENKDVVPPAVITSIQIIELDANRQIVGQSYVSGSFRSGDAIDFTSDASDSATSPTTLQALVRGQQILGDSTSDRILHTFIIDFSSECLSSSDEPLLSLGQPLGWFIAVSRYNCSV